MTPEDLLTIILTLKDRHDFTIRWLEWAIYQNCKFQILIADGSSDDKIKNILILEEKYKKLNIQYFRYPYDSNLNFWFRKNHSITEKVVTKYCIQADNDDFILFSSLKEAIIKFEEYNNLNVYSRPQLRINFKSNKKFEDINQFLYPQKNILLRKINYNSKFDILYKGNDIEKLQFSILNFEASLIWYGIHKTENLKRIHSKVLENNYGLAMMQEWFLYYSSSIGNGCLIEDGSPFLIRQEMTSTVAASLVNTERLDKIFLNKSWSRDLHLLIKDLYDLSKIDNFEYDEFEFWFKKNFHNYLSSWNKFQYFVDKFKPKFYYQYLTIFLETVFKIKNKNIRYKSINSFLDNEDIKRLKVFLSNNNFN
jgi:glycosyltransferase domain-containing protein